MTRVLHVLDHSLPLHSGYTFRTRAILKAQQAMGLEVRGVTGQRHSAAVSVDPEEVDGLLFYRTPGGGAGLANGLPLVREWAEVTALADRIVALAQEWRPDVLHAHSPALCGLAAIKAGRRLGIPVVYEIRAFWEDAAVGNGTGREGSAKYWLTRVLENDVVSGADRVVTICDGLRQDLIARGFSPEKISIMPNGVDLAMFGDPLPRDGQLAQELALGDGPVIGFLGSFYPYEGLDDLIAAMPAIVARVPGVRLLLVGGGPAEAALRAQASASAAADAIRFVGRVPHHEVDRYYSLVDVVCYPRKGMRLTELVTPLKPLEAMAQGKLVAASDVGGHRELIQHGITGTLFPADDPAGLAAAMADLLSDRSTWDERRAVARRFVGEQHDWAINVTRYHPVYQVLLPRFKLPALAA
ncbi:MAG: glycosyltransferase, exosortase A system-associated [Novosphingobium sp. 28-62-57]|uniref:TIGR04063 family PEP-CTERM/XrtA system glycosyltransferase n=1 Tax=unclassified Novosphingobium TaxID=2644732 RepID=UPI000BC90091|nr:MULTISPECIES: TIGR04063 family PEP-CTERM/XrtA system glycosyltransferase [unclassified Novosphingobium]OYW48394.1 MAG: glycosyltransferase, exosortase A system-associated [Novosphingobium sp. 12-62-10]OYZ09257.1 MAG: glycosyltransferase, exosortase A system-associated [Novosphingobium sp. 28-62-57]OZA36094.1 MAG: glycosyltransferase, exosortase A system-associated [Novosphingobium sp. 17-62-9]HQS69500.1 glycosyltransferase, exosortase A system-associated [Novosphingobium sp.]